MAVSLKDIVILGLLALAGVGSVRGHAGHHHDGEDEIVLSQSKKEELLLKWEQEVRRSLRAARGILRLANLDRRTKSCTVGVLWRFDIRAFENSKMPH